VYARSTLIAHHKRHGRVRTGQGDRAIGPPAKWSMAPSCAAGWAWRQHLGVFRFEAAPFRLQGGIPLAALSPALATRCRRSFGLWCIPLGSPAWHSAHHHPPANQSGGDRRGFRPWGGMRAGGPGLCPGQNAAKRFEESSFAITYQGAGTPLSPRSKELPLAKSQPGPDPGRALPGWNLDSPVFATLGGQFPFEASGGFFPSTVPSFAWSRGPARARWAQAIFFGRAVLGAEKAGWGPGGTPRLLAPRGGPF